MRESWPHSKNEGAGWEVGQRGRETDTAEVAGRSWGRRSKDTRGELEFVSHVPFSRAGARWQ